MNSKNNWNVKKYKKHADFVSNLAHHVLDLLEPKIYSKKEGWVLDYVRLRLKALKRF